MAVMTHMFWSPVSKSPSDDYDDIDMEPRFKVAICGEQISITAKCKNAVPHIMLFLKLGKVYMSECQRINIFSLFGTNLTRFSLLFMEVTSNRFSLPDISVCAAT